jgi:RNA polymerase sigma-70 factor (ECF subfamily)
VTAVVGGTAAADRADGPDRADRVDRLAFEEVYRRDYARLVGLAHGLSGSRTAAEELVQEAFLAAHRQWSEIGRYDDPAAWVRRVVVNRSVNVVRRRVAEGLALARLGARRELPDALPERDEAVWRAVRSLPRRQAQVVALHYVDDRPVAEIAVVLRCAEGTVKAHLHQARQSLARMLGHEAEATAPADELDEPDDTTTEEVDR